VGLRMRGSGDERPSGVKSSKTGWRTAAADFFAGAFAWPMAGEPGWEAVEDGELRGVVVGDSNPRAAAKPGFVTNKDSCAFARRWSGRGEAKLVNGCAASGLKDAGS
jgi:hypothetical protein